jgi:hypothetical protein
MVLLCGRNVRKKKMAAGVAPQVSLSDTIDFLENVVLLSFGIIPLHANEQARLKWIEMEAGARYGEYIEDLMLLAGALETKEEVQEELKEERLLLQQQTSKSLRFLFQVTLLFFSLLYFSGLGTNATANK